MAWDYLEEHNLPSTRGHYFAESNWQTIGVQVGGKRENYIILTREEWKTLNRFLAKWDFDAFLPKDYAHLPDPVRLILDDYLAKY